MKQALKNNTGKNQLLALNRKGLLIFIILSLTGCLFFPIQNLHGFILSGVIYSAAERIGITIAFNANRLSEKDMLYKMILGRVTMLAILTVFFIFIYGSRNYNNFFVSLGLLMSVISHRVVFYKWQCYE
jgi:hypothetical protein